MTVGARRIDWTDPDVVAALAAAREHGTYATYTWEHRHGIPTCPACRAAHACTQTDRKHPERATSGPAESGRATPYRGWPHPTWKPSAGMDLGGE